MPRLSREAAHVEAGDPGLPETIAANYMHGFAEEVSTEATGSPHEAATGR